MSDLISREALIENFRHQNLVYVYGSNVIEAIIRRIEEQPTVEAKEVVHGEWIRTRFASEYICSNCQALTYAELTRTGYKNYNFCPQCGCDMRTSAE